jgi:hypothetical protein
VGFEPTIPVFERATVIGWRCRPFLTNVCKYLLNYTASHPYRHTVRTSASTYEYILVQSQHTRITRFPLEGPTSKPTSCSHAADTCCIPLLVYGRLVVSLCVRAHMQTFWIIQSDMNACWKLRLIIQISCGSQLAMPSIYYSCRNLFLDLPQRKKCKIISDTCVCLTSCDNSKTVERIFMIFLLKRYIKLMGEPEGKRPQDRPRSR